MYSLRHVHGDAHDHDVRARGDGVHDRDHVRNSTLLHGHGDDVRGHGHDDVHSNTLRHVHDDGVRGHGHDDVHNNTLRHVHGGDARDDYGHDSHMYILPHAHGGDDVHVLLLPAPSIPSLSQ